MGGVPNRRCPYRILTLFVGAAILGLLPAFLCRWRCIGRWWVSLLGTIGRDAVGKSSSSVVSLRRVRRRDITCGAFNFILRGPYAQR